MTRLFAVALLSLCACEGEKAPGSADAQVAGAMPGGASGSSASGGSSGSANSGAGASGRQNRGGSEPGAGCTPAPAPSTPRVLSGELAAIISRCGRNGAQPPLVGPEEPTRQMQIAVSVLSPRADELAMFAMEVSDPNSPLYRHFLTEEQLTALFGPSPCNYQAVVDWLKAEKIQVTMTYSDRFLIDAIGTVAQLEAALHVTINDYLRPDGTKFYAPDRDPSVPVGAAIAIDGLDNCYVPTHAVAGPSAEAGTRD